MLAERRHGTGSGCVKPNARCQQLQRSTSWCLLVQISGVHVLVQRL